MSAQSAKRAPARASVSCLPIARANRRLDVPAHVEVALDLDAQRIAGLHKVFEDHIDDMLVKNFYLAKRIDVKLQTLQFDAALVRRVLQPNRGKVGKIRERTNAGELWNVEFDLNLAAGKFISESVERIEIHLRARRRLNVEALWVWWRQFWLLRSHSIYLNANSPETARSEIKNNIRARVGGRSAKAY